MRSHPYRRGLLSVLLVVLAYAGTSSQLTAVPSLTEHPSPRDGRSPLLSDLDGDGAADSVRVSTGEPRFIIELHLSGTQTYHMVPFPAAVTDQGSLWVQDVDGDGDADLLWTSALPAYTTFLWVNDGSGRFECLCLPDRQHNRVILVGAGISSLTPSHASVFLSLPDHSPAPGRMLAKHWELPTPSLVRKLRLEVIWKQFVLSPPFQRRGPPVCPQSLRC